MILYHGSYMEIPCPDIYHSRKSVDFGQGFYTTPIRKQAINWSGKFKQRGRAGALSGYEFNEKAFDELKVLRFDSYSEEWLDFIVICRRGEDSSTYDIVTGGVANDKVFNTIELYFDGLIDKYEAISRLRFEKPNMQYCFRKQSVIDKYLKFKGSEMV